MKRNVEGGYPLQYDYVNPEQQLLTLNFSDEKVDVYYANNANPFPMPLIGPRPPFYANMRFEQYFPII